MSTTIARSEPAARPPPARANERLKQSWNRWLAASITVAVVLHALLLVFWPDIPIDVESYRRGSPVAVLSPGAAPEARIPEPPGEIRFPAPRLPTVADVELNLFSDLAISLPHIDDPALRELSALVPTHPTNPDRWLDYESFAPYLSYPRIRNEGEVRRFLTRHYEPLLQLTGASGVVHIAFWIDEGGEVWKAELAQSSGSRSLDRLAMRLSNMLRFSPATRLGRPVRVQVRVPIIFRET